MEFCDTKGTYPVDKCLIHLYWLSFDKKPNFKEVTFFESIYGCRCYTQHSRKVNHDKILRQERYRVDKRSIRPEQGLSIDETHSLKEVPFIKFKAISLTYWERFTHAEILRRSGQMFDSTITDPFN
jgi:hypothetical protein